MKNTNITAKEIMRKIRNNERFAKIIETVKVMSDKYGPITAAGGSLVDCYFNKDFYDIDLFISVEDLKDEYKKEDYKQRSHILDVLRDELNGEALDIIVVDYSVHEHISRFDQNFKKIFYSNNRIGIFKEAIEDINKGQISLGSLNGPTVYFRCIKSSEKYGLKINEDDLYENVNQKFKEGELSMKDSHFFDSQKDDEVNEEDDLLKDITTEEGGQANETSNNSNEYLDNNYWASSINNVDPELIKTLLEG